MRDALLTGEQRESLADALPEWILAEQTLERDVTAGSFPAAIDWVVAIADAAESLDHHPDIDIRWRTLHLVLSTHSAGGLTQLDVDLAIRIEAIVGT